MRPAGTADRRRKGPRRMVVKCEICGKVIPKARLEILPTTKRCVDCAKKNGTDVQAKRTEVGMDIETYKDLLGAIRS